MWENLEVKTISFQRRGRQTVAGQTGPPVDLLLF